MYHPQRLERYATITQLDALRDHQEIARLSAAYDFPLDTQRAYQLAMLRTFCIPRSSKIMVNSGAFIKQTQKRYDDTMIIIGTIGLYGYDSPKGRAAIRRMNQIHRHYPIPNDEYLYVLSTFVLSPIEWNRRFGWRPLSASECEAGYHFWHAVGKRMGLRDIPPSLAALRAYSDAYERAHFAYHPNNRLLVEACLELFLGWYLPKPLWRLGRNSILCLFDTRMLKAFGYSPPPAALCASVNAALRANAAAVRLLPPRKHAYTLPRTRTYGNAPIAMADLGPHTSKMP